MGSGDLPTHPMATGVLVWDPDGRALLVQTWNRDHLILPGGLVEVGESPADAGRREVAEETGLHIELGRLLVVEHQPARDDRPASVQFVFDSAPLGAIPELTHQADEIAAAHWVPREDVVRRHGARGRARMAAALDARDRDDTVYLDGSGRQ